ncbi:Clavaminate synthase-like protein [Annulohypoxylon bovei var. microspora]|nr:Clavaminate synthase-like protein [Annulohypoxylon bovei var. microspora]
MLSSLKLNSRLASFGHVFHCSKGSSRSQSTSTVKQPLSGVETVKGKIELNSFRKLAWDTETPLLLRASHKFPASKKWFQSSGKYPIFSVYFQSFEDQILPYEFTIPSDSPYSGPNSEHYIIRLFLKYFLESSKYKASSLIPTADAIKNSMMDEKRSIDNPVSFSRFDAPLALIIAACHFNGDQNPGRRVKNLYVAQSDLSHLPESLVTDLPTPDIVKHAGKGDIYSSSIWLGLQPTYTPLHRDPNPNLFCQLVGSKRIRLMEPRRGDAVYAQVRKELGLGGNSRFRGTEMMEGRERQLLHDATWGDESVSEVLLNPTDALFIPKGWWHTVASNGVHAQGALNASVNWWFR